MIFSEKSLKMTGDLGELNRLLLIHPCNKSPSAIAVTIVAAIAGVRTYESVPLYAVPL